MKISELEKTNRYIWSCGNNVQFENDTNRFDGIAMQWFSMMEQTGCETMQLTMNDKEWYFQINYDVHPELNKFC